jgi:glycosyltransferase involved in cell wall biosynthesis
MRVAVICAKQFKSESDVGRNEDDSDLGGGERYPTALASALSEFVTTDLITCTYERPMGSVSLRTYTADNRTLALSESARSIIGISKRLLERYDILHFVQENEIAALTAVFARATRRSRVFLTPVGGGRRSGMNQLRLAECFDGFLTISKYSTMAYPWLQKTKRPISVIYGGGDRVDHRGGPLKEDLPLGNQEVVVSESRDCVLFVGRLLPHKGVDVLLRALPNGMSATIVGPCLDRAYFDYLCSIARARGADVRFETSANDVRLRELYRRAQVTVLPSVSVDYRGVVHEHSELLGLVVLEAMWEGSPVIASAGGAMDEIVDSSYGFLVTPGDVSGLATHIERFADMSTVKRYGDAATRVAHRRFSWRSVAQEVLSGYARD